MLETVDIRGFARDKHRSVDDAPFGGGAGMVMLPQVLDDAVQAVRRPGERLIYLSPARPAARSGAGAGAGGGPGDRPALRPVRRGRPAASRRPGGGRGQPGRFRPVRRRDRRAGPDRCRGALAPRRHGQRGERRGGEFRGRVGAGLLEYPHYTRPALWTGADGASRAVPEILVSGHHAKVRRWRLEQAESITRERRPDLWQRYLAVNPERAEGGGSHVRKRPGRDRRVTKEQEGQEP